MKVVLANGIYKSVEGKEINYKIVLESNKVKNGNRYLDIYVTLKNNTILPKVKYLATFDYLTDTLIFLDKKVKSNFVKYKETKMKDFINEVVQHTFFREYAEYHILKLV